MLEPRLQTISKELAEGGARHFSQLIGRLKENPSLEAPPHQKEVTYDQMILSLLNKVFDEVVVKRGVPKDDLDQLGPALSKEFDEHVANLNKVTADAKKGLEEDLAEQRKHITSEDIKVGWDSKVIVRLGGGIFRLLTAFPPQYIPPPKEKTPEPTITPKAKPTKTTTAIETLNTPSVRRDALNYGPHIAGLTHLPTRLRPPHPPVRRPSPPQARSKPQNYTIKTKTRTTMTQISHA